MSVSRVIALGASAGGIEALSTVLRGVPADIPAAILVVCHMAASSPGILPTLLARAASVPVSQARDGDALRVGQVYVCAPDHHLLVDSEAVRLTRGPKENHHRPAVDPLFRAVARVFGAGAVGVVLSGNLDDGTAGLLSIHRAGGQTIVQAPADATFPGMPASALANVPVDHVVPAAGIGPLLSSLVRRELPPSTRDEPPLPLEDRIADPTSGVERDTRWRAKPSAFVCPDCSGTLFEIGEGDLVRYRCRVGHAYAPESLERAKALEFEEALWAAMRALEEHAELARLSAVRARERGDESGAVAFDREAGADERRVELVRSALIESATKR